MHHSSYSVCGSHTTSHNKKMVHIKDNLINVIYQNKGMTKQGRLGQVSYCLIRDMDLDHV
jgi:hypothetical protein